MAEGEGWDGGWLTSAGTGRDGYLQLIDLAPTVLSALGGSGGAFGAELGRYLADEKITYLSTVPTMLTTLPEDVPGLSTIVLSGEVCPPELVGMTGQPCGPSCSIGGRPRSAPSS